MDPELYEQLIAQLSESVDPDNPESLNEAIAALEAENLIPLRAELASQLAGFRDDFRNGTATPDEIEAMREARAYLDAVDVRLAAEAAEIADLVAEAEELANGVEVEETEEEEESEEETETEPAGEDEEETEEEEQEEEPVTASNRPLPRPGALNRHRPRNTEPAALSPTAALTAAGDLDGFSPGHAFTDRHELAQAIHDMARKTRGGKDGRRYTVARMNFEHGTALSTKDGEYNFEVMRDLERQFDRDPDLDPITASGGFCAPEMPLYDFFDIAEEDGLLTLPALDAPRGKISIPESPSIDLVLSTTEWDAAIAQDWTEADDIAVDPEDEGTWKNCYFVPCDDNRSFQVSAAVTCLEFGNFHAKFWAESVANNAALSLKAHTHKVNARQIAALVALGVDEVAVTVANGTNAGAIVQLLHNLEFHAQEYRDKYRMNVGARLDLKLPAWVQGAIFNDAVLRDATVSFDKTLGWFDSVLSARGLSVEWLQDWQGIVGENDYPVTVDALIQAPGTAARLDEGRLDFGVTRDTASNRRNTYQQFVETFQGVALVGHEVRNITGIPIYPTGGTGARIAIATPAS